MTCNGSMHPRGGWKTRRARLSRQHGARFPRSPKLGLVKFWSSSRGEERRRGTKPELGKTLNFGKWRSLASGVDAFRVNRTQEVAGSSPASSITGTRSSQFEQGQNE